MLMVEEVLMVVEGGGVDGGGGGGVDGGEGYSLNKFDQNPPKLFINFDRKPPNKFGRGRPK